MNLASTTLLTTAAPASAATSTPSAADLVAGSLDQLHAGVASARENGSLVSALMPLSMAQQQAVDAVALLLLDGGSPAIDDIRFATTVMKQMHAALAAGDQLRFHSFAAQAEDRLTSALSVLRPA